MSQPAIHKGPRRGRIHLRILSLTDLHMDIRGYDYFKDRPTKRGGLIRAAALIDRLRAEAPNTLLFDNGDMLQGNPMGDYAAEKIGQDATFPHPMIAALNALGPDAATLGNHEFNFGLPVLQLALRQARFPVVSANVATRLAEKMEEDTHLVPPYVLLNRTFLDEHGQDHAFKVGVFGLLPPQILAWDRQKLSGAVQTRDIYATAAHYAPLLRKAGADLIIALCHSGIEDVSGVSGLENAVLPVAALEEVDVVIAGHSHQVFPSPAFAGLLDVDAERGLISGTPTVMPGSGGSHLGQIDLRLAPTDMRWRITDAKVRAAETGPSADTSAGTADAILHTTDNAHRATLHHIRRPVGATDRPLDSYFAMVEPSTSVRFVATAQAWYLHAALQDTALAHLPLLSAAAPFKMGGRAGPDHYTHVPAGQVTMRHVADIYGFPNAIRALRITGASLRDWLEHSAGVFAQIAPGTGDQALIDTGFAAHSFDTITGITYAIDLTAPSRFDARGRPTSSGPGRIRDLRWRDHPVTDDMAFVVATNDYRASRSGTYPGADDGELVLAPEVSVRDVLIRFLRETPSDRPLAPRPWRLLPVPGARVRFETGPEALADPERLRALSVEPLGQTDAGFLMCRKALHS